MEQLILMLIFMLTKHYWILVEIYQSNTPRDKINELSINPGYLSNKLYESIWTAF